MCQIIDRTVVYIRYGSSTAVTYTDMPYLAMGHIYLVLIRPELL